MMSYKLQACAAGSKQTAIINQQVGPFPLRIPSLGIGLIMNDADDSHVMGAGRGGPREAFQGADH